MHCCSISSNDVYRIAAKKLISTVDESLSRKESVALLLSGGSAVRLYPYLVDWIKEHPNRSFQGMVAVGQVDDRFFGEVEGYEEGVERKKNINAESIRGTGLWNVCHEKGIACHLISQSGTVEESSSEYNQTISGLWKSASKKIVVLGIGEDGHTAGLLPGYQRAWDVDRFVVGYTNDGPFPQRISLTPKALKSLDYALVVAAGETKRPVLDRLSSADRKSLNSFPGAILREMKTVEVFTDVKMQT